MEALKKRNPNHAGMTQLKKITTQDSACIIKKVVLDLSCLIEESILTNDNIHQRIVEMQ
jgi:hypothetical protein